MHFSTDEKKKAEAIFDQLEGMSIASAERLLNKCYKLLKASKVGSVRGKFAKRN